VIIVPHATHNQYQDHGGDDEFHVCACSKQNKHECSNCFDEYCDCTKKMWAVGEGGVTYCTERCALESFV
jgi:hypothetical protein